MEYAIKNNGIYESIEFYSNIIQTQGKGTIQVLAKINDSPFAPVRVISEKNSITKLRFPDSVVFKLQSNKPFTYTIPNYTPHYFNKYKVEDYLYNITYGNIDYSYAKQYIDKAWNTFGGCSAIRNGNYFGRNFDWKYNHQVQFVVNTPSSLDHYGVIGVAGIVNGITNDTVDQDDIVVEGIDMFKLLPFCLLDGINEKGVFCTQNVVPLDNYNFPTREVEALVEEKERICITMLVRYILDRFSSAKAAYEYIRDYVTIYFTDTMIDDWKYQTHLMLGDKTNTYIIEFINGKIMMYEHQFITNFPITGVQCDPTEGTILYPPTQYGMNPYGAGLERWNIIATNYSKCNELQGIKEVLDSIKYSNTYNNDKFWYSEIVGMHDDEGNVITVDTPKELCTNAKHQMRIRWAHKNRDTAEVWITCHTSMYDIKSKTLFVSNQESNTFYYYTL